RLAVTRAGDRARGSAAASDAYFPFPDGLQVLIDAGVAAVVQPGGSGRDPLVVAAAAPAKLPLLPPRTRPFFPSRHTSSLRAHRGTWYGWHGRIPAWLRQCWTAGRRWTRSRPSSGYGWRRWPRQAATRVWERSSSATIPARTRTSTASIATAPRSASSRSAS